ncbi:hypothetical protein [Phytohabitans rumicis]|uniref:Lipoprotein n=1 Tax=Phytohabitans rumicis TaxID=1076125 RepID=A0A6V8LA09_9ACTN|nr:hypothetical protein [Phytohabitans rumicis]GFJ94052.1 hypothetical protein Prum_076940 [Phytohabitans rumicis]
MRRLPIVLLVLACAGCDTSPLRDAEDLTRYAVPGTVTALDLRGGSGAVEIVAVEGPLRVQERRLYADLPPLTSHRVEDGTLYLVDRGCGKKADAAGQCETHYRVEAPPGIAVTVQVGTAPVTLTGITGPVQVTTEVGAITGSGMAGATKASTSVGDIELRYAAPPSAVDVTNDVGATRVYLPAAGAYRIEAKTDAGAVVDLPSRPDAANKITVRASTGEITVGPA